MRERWDGTGHRNRENLKGPKAGKRSRRGAGFTMLELLMVVGIVAILSGVAFVNVISYQRGLQQIERDSVAREIFVAAQNHLTVARGEGYGGVTYSGEEIDQSSGEALEKSGIFQLVYPQDEKVLQKGSILEAMLPPGSLDETVRTGGSYIITYQKEPGLILDVFYTSRNGSPNSFNHTLAADEYGSLMADYREEDKKTQRRNCTIQNGRSFVLGWYGGTEAISLAKIHLETPVIKVENGSRLTVTITDPNMENLEHKDSYTLSLRVSGKESGAVKVLTIKLDDPRVSWVDGKYVVVLDDVTEPGLHFGDLGSDNSIPFLWGEDIEMQALATSTVALANEAKSESQVTNSLFEEAQEGSISVQNIRHLENLERAVSRNKNNGTGITPGTGNTKVTQTSDISWEEFVKELSLVKKQGITPAPEGDAPVYIYDAGGNTLHGSEAAHTNARDDSRYRPVDLSKIDYDGGNHKISGIVVDADQAGLFGTVEDSSLKNLKLLDFQVTGTDNAGALAAQTVDTVVENVVAYHTDAGADKGIHATGSAGGLIGLMEGGSVIGCGAALRVGDSSNVPENAGGLIGRAVSDSKENGPVIMASYSGGHTDQGSYESLKGSQGEILYDVTGAHAGGLIGSAGDASISCSYSTCSVEGRRKTDSATDPGTGTGGGFLGRVESESSVTVTHSYCTGLTSGEGDNAFLGEGAITGEENYFYGMINKVVTRDGSGNVTDLRYKASGTTAKDSSGNPVVSSFDANASEMNSFWPRQWDAARAYDKSLVEGYQGGYALPSVWQLVQGAGPEDLKEKIGAYASLSNTAASTHYGDWPSAENLFVNEPIGTGNTSG